MTWDVAALRSIVAFSFACADHTLVEQVQRRPWLSAVVDNQPPHLETPPPHGLRGYSNDDLVKDLHAKLLAEARRVCTGRKAIYLTLSGGLDSRIVAGIVAQLHRAGDLECKPVAVTWGLENSRDVVYGREVAKLLEFDWIHVPLEPEHLWENVHACAEYLGALVPPTDLHRFAWFKQLERDALVLGGTYGDSVGRGEFSGRTILELRPLKAGDALGLLSPEAAAAGDLRLAADAAALRARGSGDFGYTFLEHQQFAFYLRGMVGHAMSMIGQFCDLYQMFTDPDIYGHMWSVHPSLRTNEVYCRLLESFGNGLAEIPWARTNRGLRGSKHGADPQLNRVYHHAADWIRGPLYGQLRELVDPEWFAATGVFDGRAVANLDRALRDNLVVQGAPGDHVSRLFGWLAAVRIFADRLARDGHAIAKPILHKVPNQPAASGGPTYTIPDGRVRRALRKMPQLRRWIKLWQADRARKRFLRDHPTT